MSNTILIKRGLKENLDSLNLVAGELAVALDTQELYVGDSTNTVKPVKAGPASEAEKLATARTIALSGDATGSVSFDGSQNVTIATTLANSGVTAGTYTKVTVDAKGRATAGTTLAASDIPTIEQSQVNGLEDALEGKADKATTLAGYGIEDAYTKTEVDAKLVAVYIYKGSVATYADLPTLTTEPTIVTGWVYNVQDTGDNYAAIVSGDPKTLVWDRLGISIDLTNYYTKTETNALLNTKVDKVEGKGLSTNDYTTAEKTKLAGIAEGAQVNVIETVQVDGTALPITNKIVNIDLSGKADVATTLAGYGITDAYTKTEIAALTLDGGTF